MHPMTAFCTKAWIQRLHNSGTVLVKHFAVYSTTDDQLRTV